MYLERIEIRGFRGINRLSLRLDQVTALIGENTWGKTSLMRALWCLLGQDEVPYQFVPEDFHRPEDPELSPAVHLQIVLTFREHRPDMSQHASRLARLAAVWVKHKDLLHRIHYRAAADLQIDGSVLSEHGFLDSNGQPLAPAQPLHLIQLLMLMNPVLRLRDSRANRSTTLVTDVWPAGLMALADTLADDPQPLPRDELKQGLASLCQLMSHYFSSVPPIRPRPRSQREIVMRPASLRGLGNLTDWARCQDNQVMHLALSGIAGAMLAARGDRQIEAGARPILILEDPESRLHPTMLALAWGLLEQLPGQKILTTNSGDLLTSLPLSQIRRLVRQPSETRSYQLQEDHFSADDLRRIAFHVRINRPMSLFARCWLLVEGETEIWLLSELASICGYSLRAEGVRIIEYAQCGYSPLIKVAKQLGIEWHLLADGDEAGAKYLTGARSLLHGDRERERLTGLPERDIEHFLFMNGFAAVFRREAKIGPRQSCSPHKIIDKAIRHRSKPGLALAVVEAAESLGADSIPPLLRQMFARVVALARSQS